MEFMLTKEDDEKLVFLSMQFLLTIGIVVSGFGIFFIVKAIINYSIIYSILAIATIIALIIFFNPYKMQYEEIVFNKPLKKVFINLRNKKTIFSTQEFDVNTISDFKITDVHIKRKKGEDIRYWQLSLKISDKSYIFKRHSSFDKSLILAEKIQDYTGVKAEIPE
ncbi:MAG: hypothetical protein V4667_10910 [Bacteroidota bacterium]